VADPETYRVRLAKAITLAIADVSTPEGETKAVILARDVLDALIANMAMIQASSPSASTPAALEDYCRQVAERLRGETAALQANPEAMRALRSDTLSGPRN
jgi:hypothetical protein